MMLVIGSLMGLKIGSVLRSVVVLVMVMVTMMIMTKEILSSEILKWQLLQFLAVIFHFVTVISTSDIYRATRAVKRQKQTTQQTYNSLNFEFSFCQRF